jgi:aryl-alcohol dehydrogenase-like predicted oxidoreductase
MQYRRLGNTDVELSIIGLGGHEYLPNGKSRGFNEPVDAHLAVKPGQIYPGFGGPRRKEIISLAYDHGINFFDVTVDSEKEALGRNLKELPPPHEIFIQTRPEGMVYTYDEHNRQMADYGLLKTEVQRGLKLLQRERLDILNIAFMQSALDNDPDYLAKIRYNVGELKREGLIRFASADTFSGEATYLTEIESGIFDTLFINFNFADDAANDRVLPAATKNGLGVNSREAFMKGALFAMGEEVGLTDRDQLARLALKWNLAQPGVTTVVTGVHSREQLLNGLSILDDLTSTNEEEDILVQLKKSETYATYARERRSRFRGR